MNEGGIVSFLLLSQTLEEDRPLPTSEGIGPPRYLVPLPRKITTKRMQTCLFSCRFTWGKCCLGSVITILLSSQRNVPGI